MKARPHPQTAPHHRQRGLGLLEVMLISLVMMGALIAGFVALRSKLPSIGAEDEVNTLAQADRYLAGFAAANNRLPCPDTNNDGWEDCASVAQKGRLPYKTLGMEGSLFNPGTGQLAYVVQRNAIDLTVAANANNRFEPLQFDNGPKKYTGRRALANFGTTADFCQGLLTARAATPAASQAHVGANTPVAYALAHPGPRDANGDGNPLDGRNSSFLDDDAQALESPEFASLLTGYDDRVVVRSYDSLLLALDCSRLIASLQGLSMATEVVEEVVEQKAANLQSAIIATTINGVKAAVAAYGVYAASVILGTAVTGMATASAALAAAIASCVVLVGCAEIPHAAASVAAYAVAIGAATVAIAANAAAVAANVIAFGMTLAAAIEAGQSQTINMDLSQAVTQAQNTLTDATNAKNQALTDLNSAQSRLTSAATARDSAWNTLLNTAHQIVTDANNAGSPTKGSMSTTFLDGYLTATRTKADTWMSRVQSTQTAREALDQALNFPSQPNGNTTANADAIAALEAELAKETDPDRRAALQAAIDRLKNPPTGTNAQQAASLSQQISTLNGQISDLDVQIAAETDPTKRADLVKRRDALVVQRDALSSQLSGMSLDLATAQTNYDAAVAAESAALQDFNNARNAAVYAFSSASRNLPYTVCTTTNDADGKPVTTCNTYYYDGTSRISDALRGLYDEPVYINILGTNYLVGWNANRGPYFAWWTRNLEVQQAQSRYNEALQKQTQAQQSLTTLQGIATGGGTGGPSGDLNPVWNKALDILKALDLRGGIR